LLVALVVLVAAAVPLSLVLLGGDDEEQDGPVAVDIERCRGLLGSDSRDCLIETFKPLVAGRDDPRPVVAEIERTIRREGGFLLSSCHGVMHTVGRTYALDRDASLSDLKDYLPRTNDPGCSAGFAHGLVTGVAPSIDPREPREAAKVCDDSVTRYQRYSCVHGLGHAFMRIHGDELGPALDLCGALGPQAAPDCSQGAFHDYWFAVVGADDATLPGAAVTDPRQLCGGQPAQFVRPCWYRAFVDNRPQGLVADSPEYFQVLCDGLTGLQREACVTAVSVVGPPDPAQQLALCAQLTGPGDAANCVRGTKVQNILGSPVDTYVRLIRGCEAFAGDARSACYRWLGKTITVVTDGAFARTGCAQLDGAARRECAAGARTADDALVTFS
jgi:hypothetical protein